MFNSTSGIRNGRIKERPSLNEPAITGRLDFYPEAIARTALDQSLRVGVSGYCWGGSLAWAAATRLDGVAAAVGYYGGQIAETADEEPRCPVLLHFGETDAGIPLSNVETVRAANPDVPVHLYPAGHGFACDARASYHAESAALALERTLAFLHEHLGG